MGRKYCPYCNKMKSEAEFTDEHILALALGSPPSITIRVCKECNKEAGRSCDAPLVNNYFIVSERTFRGLRGESGNLPKIEFRGNISIGDKDFPARYTYSLEEKGLRIMPDVTKKNDGVRDFYKVGCSEEDFDRIIADIGIKQKKKHGEGTKLDIRKESTISIPTPEMQVTMKIDTTCMQRGMVKTAIGLGYYVLGESWAKSKSGDLMRQFIWEPDLEKRAGILHGSLWPESFDAELIELLSYRDWHVLVVMNRNPVGFFINLFGKFQGTVKYQDGVTGILNGNEESGVVFLIDPVARKLYRYGFATFVAKKLENDLP